MAATLEQKIDLILNWIATDDESIKNEIRNEAVQAIGAVTFADYSIDDTIDELLRELGVGPHLIGYSYISYAIRLVESDRRYSDRITGLLYPKIAEEYSTTPIRVERGIRHAIEVAWDRIDLDTAYRIFGNTVSRTRGKPTNSEFITTCVNELKRRRSRWYNM